MSVAVGTPQPWAVSGLAALNARYTPMGTSTPPTAPMMGRIAWRMLVSSPTVISYLISRPTSRKNSAMNRSLMTCAMDMPAIWSPKKKPISICRNSSKGP